LGILDLGLRLLDLLLLLPDRRCDSLQISFVLLDLSLRLLQRDMIFTVIEARSLHRLSQFGCRRRGPLQRSSDPRCDVQLVGLQISVVCSFLEAPHCPPMPAMESCGDQDDHPKSESHTLKALALLLVVGLITAWPGKHPKTTVFEKPAPTWLISVGPGGQYADLAEGFIGPLGLTGSFRTAHCAAAETPRSRLCRNVAYRELAIPTIGPGSSSKKVVSC
jgi:hypothetical protein